MGHEANHSPQSSAEVKNACSYTSTPPCVFMTWYNKDNRTNILLKDSNQQLCE